MSVVGTSLHPVDLGGLRPVEVAARLRHLPGLVFFDSAREPAGISVISARPEKVMVGTLAEDWGSFSEELQAREMEGTRDDGCPHGLAAGYVGYDGRFTFGFYPEVLVYHHGAGQWSQIGALAGEMREAALTGEATERLRFEPALDSATYCGMVRRAQEYIAAGDIYQVNLAHRFAAAWRDEPWALYESLRCCSPAPQAAYLQMGETHVLSASPELFLRFSGRCVQTRPIKGTRPRFRDPHADEKSAYDLITSPKEIAELVMITDLERNDLGQVCEWGSVNVRELLTLERFEQVFHLVSTVEGQLRAGVSQTEAFRACFPGGSITGAPKKRAREIIAELEPEPRGLYTGAIGWFGYNGESQFNIAIRTIFIEGQQAHFHVGAGIVADSDPEREWQETLAKASGLLLAAERR